MSEAQPKKRKPRTPKLTIVEKRLEAGAVLMKTASEKDPRGCFWTFLDSGRTARADIVERLMAAGRLKPRGDDLFGDGAQTWTLA